MLKAGDKVKLVRDVEFMNGIVVQANSIVTYIKPLNTNGLHSFRSDDGNPSYDIPLHYTEFEIIKETEMNTKESQGFNLEDHLEEVLAGRLVKLRNGKKAKIVADLRAEGNNQVPFNSIYGHCLVGFFNDETSMVSIWDLNGRNNPDVSEDDMWDIIGLVDVVEFPENMWDIIDPKWNYMAIDEDGESWFYLVEPAISEGECCWDSSANDCTKNELIKVSTTDWTKSLIKRPGI